MQINRRQFLVKGGIAAAAIGIGGAWQPRSQAVELGEFGPAFDEAMNKFMKDRQVPGGSLAVVKDCRLVHVRGYGMADLEKKEPVQPESLFRIASISKPFTSATVIKLVAAGKLKMDAPAFEILQLEPLAGKKEDPRIKQITIRHLLHHTGGWDRDQSGDPMFMSRRIARAAGESGPASQHAIIRYMLGQPLDFDPGARYAYSNFGYCVLGRIIEKITGEGYEAFVKKEIMSPIGITRMRQGVSRESGRAPGEVKYYMPNRELIAGLVDSDGESGSAPYTGFCLESMDSHGAWLASAVDLARFAAALDGPGHQSWLSNEARHMLYEPPAPPVSRRPDGSVASPYYACGWSVRLSRRNGKASYSHDGSLPGTATILLRRFDGVTFAALFNQRSTSRRLPDNAISGALVEAAGTVTNWPAFDLFEKYS